MLSEKEYMELKNPLCLVVEDSPAVQFFYEALLKKAGLSFVIAKNGNDAMEHLEEFDRLKIKPDFFIVDIMMPIMDGSMFLKEIKKHPTFSSTPVIIISAITDENFTVKFLMDYKPRTYMAKPVDTPKLLEEIRAIVSTPPEETK